MGCDIHAYVEYKNQNADREHWNTFGGRVNPGRNYLMFGYLAGVRYDGPAVVPPRGIPDRLGWESSDDWWLWIVEEERCSCGESNRCSRADAERYHAHGSAYRGDKDGKPQWVQAPDWHTPSWLTTDEFEAAITAYQKDDKDWGDPTEYRALLAAMRVLESNGTKARIVFWFDN